MSSIHWGRRTPSIARSPARMSFQNRACEPFCRKVHVADVFDAVETVAFGGSEAPVAAAAESGESEVVSDAAFRPLGRGVLLVAAAAACLL